MKPNLLICDEDRNLSEVLRGIFRRMEKKVRLCEDLESLRKELTSGESCELMVCDVRLWQKSCLDAAGDVLVLANKSGIPAAVSAVYGMQSVAAQALKAGAFAVLLKPFHADDVLAVMEKAKDFRPEKADCMDIASPRSGSTLRHFGYLIGETPRMLELYSQIERVAMTDMTVFVRGESGTGKELVARAIHEQSPRAGKPFLAVNCASLNDELLASELFGYVKGAFTGAFRNKTGLFQAAEGGTLFLDEIGSISRNMQQTLLRVLEDHTVRPVGGTESIPVQVRIIAATNEDMEKRVADGQFRLDLFHRLNVLPLVLPPLRERPEDIAAMADYFLCSADCSAQLTQEALQSLVAYSWPGNVRQLENLMMRVAALLPKEKKLIGAADLPEEIRTAQVPAAPEQEESNVLPNAGTELTLKAYLHLCERHYLHLVLEKFGGDKESAARSLGISLATLYRKQEECK